MSTHQISWKSDQNCGRDSALVFSIKMAAVTSPIMLMSQNINNRFENLNIIPGLNVHIRSLNVFWPVTICKKLLNSILPKFDRYFNGRF